MTTLTYRIAIGAGAIALIALAPLLFLSFAQPVRPAPDSADIHSTAPLSEAIRAGTLPRPPLTASTTIKALSASKGFNALVSYTDFGFEPKALTIKAGQTVRFTNNSSHPLRVVATNAAASDALDCPHSVFDSCSLKPQASWEFTFQTAGQQNFLNALDPTKSGTVEVK